MLNIRKRKRLPDYIFAGPNRTFPCHDAAHTRQALAKTLMLFRDGVNRKEMKKIHMIVSVRARQEFGIKHSCELCGWEEPKPWRVS